MSALLRTIQLSIRKTLWLLPVHLQSHASFRWPPESTSPEQTPRVHMQTGAAGGRVVLNSWADKGRLHRRCVDRHDRRRTVPPKPWRDNGDRPCRTLQCRQTDAEGTLGRRRRFGGKSHTRQRVRANPVLRCCRRLRPRAGDGFSWIGCVVHSPRRIADRCRQRDGTEVSSPGHPGPPRSRSGSVWTHRRRRQSLAGRCL